MTSRILVRHATAGDAPAILDVLHEAYAEYRDRLDPPSGVHDVTPAGVTDLRNREQALVAEQAGRVVGCIFLALSYAEGDRRGWLHRLAVLPTARGQGIGAQLVAGVETLAAQARVAQVELAVRIPLGENQRFYMQQGYIIVDARTHEGYARPTYYVMRKARGDALAPPFHIQVVPYDAEWPARFATEAARLTPAFGDNLMTIHHVGSTSVTGLAAKPIIDMLPEVRDIGEVDNIIPAMRALGYEAMGEFGLPGRRYFRRIVDGVRTHHVHAYAAGDPELMRHLAFPAYLNAHPAEAARYGALKQTLAVAHPHDIDAYMAGKDGLIQELQVRALAWYAPVCSAQLDNA